RAFGQLEAWCDHQRGHAGAALVAGHLDAVHHGLAHVGAALQRCGDFGGGNVLALPTEGVADAIDEVEEAALVLAHEIATAIPGVAWLEDVAQHLLLRGLRVRIALVLPGASLGARDLADGLADFARGHAPAVSGGLTPHPGGVCVAANQRDAQPMREKGRNAADRAGSTLAVVQREIGFGRGVVLEDLGNTKALLKGEPYVAAQAVATAQAQRVPALVLIGWLRKQVAT